MNRMFAALAAAFLWSCGGGTPSMASKSAAAYAEAQKKGVKQMSRSMPAMEHHAMTGPERAQMRGMKMQHGGTPACAHSMAGMDSMSMPGMQHGEMPPMQGMPGMSGMQHSAATNVVVNTEAPRTSGAMVNAQPAATLRGDDLDAPAPISQSEAAKVTGAAMTHTKEH